MPNSTCPQLHLLHELLVFDPAIRITLQTALNHEYLNWAKARVGFQGATSLEMLAPHLLSMVDIENASDEESLLGLMAKEVALLCGRQKRRLL